MRAALAVHRNMNVDASVQPVPHPPAREGGRPGEPAPVEHCDDRGSGRRQQANPAVTDAHDQAGCEHPLYGPAPVTALREVPHPRKAAEGFEICDERGNHHTRIVWQSVAHACGGGQRWTTAEAAPPVQNGGRSGGWRPLSTASVAWRGKAPPNCPGAGGTRQPSPPLLRG